MNRTHSFANRGLRLACLLLLPFLFFSCWKKSGPEDVIKVGVLNSYTGTLSMIGKPTAEATLMAIEEINQKGGLLGKKLVPVIADGRSDPATFTKEAERLIVEERVKVIFGIVNSASRKTAKTVFEKHNHLLFYPMTYEGLEQSPNVIYVGSAPNQQIIPTVKWAYENVGKRVFLVGSDLVYSRAANAMIQDQLAALRGEVVGEEYILWGSQDVKGVIEKIVERKPTVILNTINGDSNVAFFRELRKAGITPDKIPTLSFTLTEREVRSMNNGRDLVGDYVAWSYFQSQTNPENVEFIKRFRAKYGADQVIDDPSVSGYMSVYLWAGAVKEAGSASPDQVRTSLPNQSFAAPEGMVYIDSENGNVWRTARIGKIEQNGSFNVMWDSGRALRPVPYPIYRTRAEWESFLNNLYQGWKRQWVNRG